MGLLKNIFKSSSGKSSSSKSASDDDALSLDESKVALAAHRNTIASLKKKHERNVQLNAATCVTERSIKRVQLDIQRIRRRYPMLASAWQDNYL